MPSGAARFYCMGTGDVTADPERRATFRFAHLADLHIGAWRERPLAEAAVQAFRDAIERCIAEQVDFIVLAGDLFDSPLPGMDFVCATAELLCRVRDAGIPTYVTYGSHDYSPTSSSVIDVLEAAGLFTRLPGPDRVGEGDGALLRPRFLVDAGTNAKLAGLPGRQRSLEREWYERLDHDHLEAEPGFKVFVFHSAITEVLPEHERYAESMPLARLPPGFDYYAGGHVHARIEARSGGGRGIVAYPGPLLGYQYGDLERAADTPRGFFIVTVDGGGVAGLEFVEVPLPPVVVYAIDAGGRTPGEVGALLDQAVEEQDHAGAIVLLRVRGTLASGEPHEVPFGAARAALEEQGALCIRLSRAGLAGPREHRPVGAGGSKEEIEARVLAAHCAGYRPGTALDDPALAAELGALLENDAGARTARRLLEAVAIEPAEHESLRAFAPRVRGRAREVLPELREG
ncbi:Calcineurin-like phosphoesterase [anaerobic digester metagenome]